MRIGTFNLNNLFSRWNVYSEEPRPTTPARRGFDALTLIPPRAWLESPAEPRSRRLALQTGTEQNSEPDAIQMTFVEVAGDGTVSKRREFKGRMIYGKEPAATARLAERVKAMKLDVLAAQEIEDLPTLEEFRRTQGLARNFPNAVLIEGNDSRFIDLGVLSRFPIGGVTSWRFRTHPESAGRRVFSRDLLQVDILRPDRSARALTILNNHLKSQIGEPAATARRRRQQAEAISTVITEQRLDRFVVLGDMNDRPDAAPLRPFHDLGLVDALADPVEVGAAPPWTDVAPSHSRWTHRYKRSNTKVDYELYDQIWVSPDLAKAISGAWIYRRTVANGDASDHDPAVVELAL